MTQIKAIKDWKYIFLDTSIIIDYLSDATKYPKNLDQQNRIKKIQQLFDEVLAEKEDKIIIYIATITLAELTKLKVPDKISKEMIELFSFGDVMFVEFGTQTANILQDNLEKYLGEGQKHQFLAELTTIRKNNGEMSARQWILDDLKIVACAKTRSDLGKLDLILTSDTKTFVPFAKKFQLPYLNSLDIPLDIFGNIDINVTINIQPQN